MTAPTASRRPPSVERVLGSARSRLEGRAHDALVAAARDVVAVERERLREGAPARSAEELADELVERLERLGSVAPGRVVNATGVILHTNLGRAPWADEAVRAASAAAAGYSFLELDPATGRRGRRFPAVVEHLVALTGADDALVTTNNAAAVALVVGLAGRGGVVVSRGELVEIGGGVRIPEIVRRAGARLIEVGTTNRTRPEDFEAPLAEGRGRLVLRVHPSNFTIAGFVEEADLAAVAAVAHRHGAIVVDDLGSGALLDTARYGLAHEPMPGERLAAGADLVTFSGDKLLGGPQAGLIVGRADLVGRLRRDPLARAMRADKAVLAALEATLALYRAGRAEEIPVWRMIAAPTGTLRARADAVVGAVTDALVAPTTHAPRVRVAEMASTVGGGSLPGDTLPSAGLAVAGSGARRGSSPDRLAAALRRRPLPVLARVAGDELLLDLRTVDPADDTALSTALAETLAETLGEARAARRR